MLEQLEFSPGHRVLEVGTGSGYNAALMAHVVGEEGLVVTVEINGGPGAEGARELGVLGGQTSRWSSKPGQLLRELL